MFFLEIVAAIVNLSLGFESPKLDLSNSSYDPFFGTTTCCSVLTPYTVQILGLILVGKKRKFGLMFFIKIVAIIVNLMLCF